MPKCIKGHQGLNSVRKSAGFRSSRGSEAHLNVSKLAQGHDGDVGLGRGDGRSRVPGVLQQVDGLQSMNHSGTEDSRCYMNCARRSWSLLQVHTVYTEWPLFCPCIQQGAAPGTLVTMSLHLQPPATLRLPESGLTSRQLWLRS